MRNTALICTAIGVVLASIALGLQSYLNALIAIAFTAASATAYIMVSLAEETQKYDDMFERRYRDEQKEKQIR
jgi:hypothetical protein